jgi:hypothetical protein
MNRRALLLIGCILLASFAGAQDVRRLSPAEQARLLSRNISLLQVTVAGSLELADQTDALDRVDACHRLMKVWAKEVEVAARQGDSFRAAEMGQYLNRVADQGLAMNLRAARSHIPPSTPDERRLWQRRDAALQDLESLEQTLADLARGQRELRPVVDRLHTVRRLVAEAADLPKP